MAPTKKEKDGETKKPKEDGAQKAAKAAQPKKPVPKKTAEKAKGKPVKKAPLSSVQKAQKVSKTIIDMATADIISRTAQYVEAALKGNDASHDYAHIQRVYDLAQNIAEEENCSADDLELVSLAALLHDIADCKYSGSETAGAEAARSYLKSVDYPDERIERVCWIIQRVSFHDEIGRAEDEIAAMKNDKILCIVQDAERCDAMGAIGIARCFTYGGKKGRRLYQDDNRQAIVRQISKADYMAAGKNSSTVDHFYEKLLLLKDKMKTMAGKKIAVSRHYFMEQYLLQLSAEVNGIL